MMKKESQNLKALGIDDLKIKAHALLSDINLLNMKIESGDFDMEKYLDDWLNKDRELSCLNLRIETETNLVAPLKDKKRNIHTNSKPPSRLTKRCG